MQVTIEKLIFGGNGMGFYMKKPVFVPYSAPNDSLEFDSKKGISGLCVG